ncbi:AlgI protein [[Clostridium] sordellii]|nr:AlgI protein [[Clostridium] sordellii] [Paeniclostridium sordellii]
MGGNKKGKLRNYINLFIVWFLTGFWHGASWTFIAWGLYFGVLIAIEKAFLGKILGKIYPPISHLYLVLVVMIGWIFFRANSFTYAFNYIKLLFGLDNNLLYNNLTIMYLNDYGYIIVLSVIFSVPIIPILKNKLHKFKETHVYYIIRSIIFMSMFGAIVIELVNSTYNPFLYFRF